MTELGKNWFYHDAGITGESAEDQTCYPDDNFDRPLRPADVVFIDEQGVLEEEWSEAKPEEPPESIE